LKSRRTTMSKRIREAVHDTARGLHEAGVLGLQTMREFDALCLPPVKRMTPARIRRIRRQSRASQTVFAAYLNTSPSTVRQWEQGLKRPNGPSLKLLDLVERKGLAVLE
jgi:putative transcriptional regulator